MYCSVLRGLLGFRVHFVLQMETTIIPTCVIEVHLRFGLSCLSQVAHSFIALVAIHPTSIVFYETPLAISFISLTMLYSLSSSLQVFFHKGLLAKVIFKALFTSVM